METHCRATRGTRSFEGAIRVPARRHTRPNAFGNPFLVTLGLAAIVSAPPCWR
jgi:hypothetical protein